MTCEGKTLSPELETKVENYALGFLSRGREGWDIPHTRAVVYYVETIAESEGLDVLVLKTAAWLHDIGYDGLFESTDSKNYDSVMDKKARHMVNGAKFAAEFLGRDDIKGYFSEEQAARIVHLVSIHDKIEELKDPDELALMEADTLGAIDISKVQTTFNKESALKYVENDLMPRRFSRFFSEKGKELFSGLLGPFVNQFDNK